MAELRCSEPGGDRVASAGGTMLTTTDSHRRLWAPALHASGPRHRRWQQPRTGPCGCGRVATDTCTRAGANKRRGLRWESPTPQPSISSRPTCSWSSRSTSRTPSSTAAQPKYSSRATASGCPARDAAVRRGARGAARHARDPRDDLFDRESGLVIQGPTSGPDPGRVRGLALLVCLC